MREWLNIDTGEFKTLEDGIVIKGINWIEIPEGAEEYYWHNDKSCCFFLKNVDGEKFYQYLDKSVWLKWHDFDADCLNQFKLKWKREKETVNPINRNEFNPLVPQEGGDHYKLRPIQPIEYSERNGLSMSQGNIVKYITRHKEKNGVEDLAKVVHYALLEAYFVYDVKGSTELKQRILKMLGD